MNEQMETGRQIGVTGMAYAPTNEQGVVLLFGRLAPKLGFCVERVHTRFPDCIARRRGKTCKIEFEYWASSYIGHPRNGADTIVCWENDWETIPREYRHLEIISLKKFVGALPRIFVVGCGTSWNAEFLDSHSRTEWNVPLNAQIGDLVVMYRSKNSKDERVSEIRDVWRVVGPFNVYGKRNKAKRWPGRQGGLRCVVRLKRPIKYAELKNDPRTRDLGVVKSRFRGKADITEYWPLVCDKIVELNPKARSALAKYRFDE